MPDEALIAFMARQVSHIEDMNRLHAARYKGMSPSQRMKIMSDLWRASRRIANASVVGKKPRTISRGVPLSEESKRELARLKAEWNASGSTAS